MNVNRFHCVPIEILVIIILANVFLFSSSGIIFIAYELKVTNIT